MSESHSSWAFVGISPDARRAAELAAEAAGMDVDAWLAQLIKYKSAMELKGREELTLEAAILSMARPSAAPAGQAPPSESAPEAPAPAQETAASATPAAPEAAPEPMGDPVPEGDETIVVAPPAAPTAVARPVTETQNQTAPEAVPEPGADDEDAAEKAPGSAPPEEAAPSLRKQALPTDALRASRLTALGQATENEIQTALDAWRDTRRLEPLAVRPVTGARNQFEVIVGVDRWHAARRAHAREVPVEIHHVSDEEAIRMAMSARLRRGPVPPLTEATIYLSLMGEAGMSTEEVARMVGKPPAHVATMVRVLNLPKPVRDTLQRGEITALHARALLDAPNPEALAREVVAKRLDIYQTEQAVRAAGLKAENGEKVGFDDVDLDVGGAQKHAAGSRESAAPSEFEPSSTDTSDDFGVPELDAPPLDAPPLAPGDFEPPAPDETEPIVLVPADVREDQVRADRVRADRVREDRAREDRVREDRDVERKSSATVERPDWPQPPSIPEPPVPGPFAHIPFDANQPASASLTPEDFAQDPPSPESPGEPADGDAASGDIRIPELTPSRPAADEHGRTGKSAPGAARRESADTVSGAGTKDVVTTELLERHLSHLLGVKVVIMERDNVGIVTLHYSSRDELSDIVSRLNSGSPA